MKMKCVKNIELLILVNLLHCAVCEKYCSDVQRNQMHKTFTSCTEQFYQQFEERESDRTDQQLVFCDLFSNLVNRCGDIWKICHEAAEVTDMKDMQVQSFYNYYDAFYVDACDVVKKYKAKPFSRVEKCSEQDQRISQNLFQKCSHDISSNVYQNIQDMSEENVVKKSLCIAMANIEGTCSKHLSQCLSKKDSAHMLHLHLEEIGHFFDGFLQNVIPSARLTGCKTFSFQIDGDLESTDNQIDGHRSDTVNDASVILEAIPYHAKHNNEIESDNILESTTLLSYLDDVYNTHLETFDINQDTNQESKDAMTKDRTNIIETEKDQLKTKKDKFEMEGINDIAQNQNGKTYSKKMIFNALESFELSSTDFVNSNTNSEPLPQEAQNENSKMLNLDTPDAMQKNEAGRSNNLETANENSEILQVVEPDAAQANIGTPKEGNEININYKKDELEKITNLVMDKKTDTKDEKYTNRAIPENKVTVNRDTMVMLDPLERFKSSWANLVESKRKTANKEENKSLDSKIQTNEATNENPEILPVIRPDALQKTEVERSNELDSANENSEILQVGGPDAAQTNIAHPKHGKEIDIKDFKKDEDEQTTNLVIDKKTDTKPIAEKKVNNTKENETTMVILDPLERFKSSWANLVESKRKPTNKEEKESLDSKIQTNEATIENPEILQVVRPDALQKTEVERSNKLDSAKNTNLIDGSKIEYKINGKTTDSNMLSIPIENNDSESVKNNNKTESANLLSYMENLYNVHLETFDINPNTEQEINRSYVKDLGSETKESGTVLVENKSLDIHDNKYKTGMNMKDTDSSMSGLGNLLQVGGPYVVQKSELERGDDIETAKHVNSIKNSENEIDILTLIGKHSKIDQPKHVQNIETNKDANNKETKQLENEKIGQARNILDLSEQTGHTVISDLIKTSNDTIPLTDNNVATAVDNVPNIQDIEAFDKDGTSFETSKLLHREEFDNNETQIDKKEVEINEGKSIKISNDVQILDKNIVNNEKEKEESDIQLPTNNSSTYIQNNIKSNDILDILLIVGNNAPNIQDIEASDKDGTSLENSKLLHREEFDNNETQIDKQEVEINEGKSIKISNDVQILDKNILNNEKEKEESDIQLPNNNSSTSIQNNIKSNDILDILFMVGDNAPNIPTADEIENNEIRQESTSLQVNEEFENNKKQVDKTKSALNQDTNSVGIAIESKENTVLADKLEVIEDNVPKVVTATNVKKDKSDPTKENQNQTEKEESKINHETPTSMIPTSNTEDPGNNEIQTENKESDTNLDISRAESDRLEQKRKNTSDIAADLNTPYAGDTDVNVSKDHNINKQTESQSHPLPESGTQFGWTNWETSGEKLVIPASKWKQESNEDKIAVAPLADIPPPEGEPSQGVKLLCGAWLNLLILVNMFQLN